MADAVVPAWASGPKERGLGRAGDNVCDQGRQAQREEGDPVCPRDVFGLVGEGKDYGGVVACDIQGVGAGRVAQDEEQ